MCNYGPFLPRTRRKGESGMPKILASKQTSLLEKKMVIPITGYIKLISIVKHT